MVARRCSISAACAGLWSFGRTTGFRLRKPERLPRSWRQTSRPSVGNGGRSMDEAEFGRANARARKAQRTGPHAVSARYLPARGRLVVVLSTGAELSMPTAGIEGLSGASADDLREIEV